MRKIFSILLLFALISSCGGNNQKQDSQITEKNSSNILPNRLEIIYFHGKQRCITCKNIQEYTQELIEQEYSKEVQNGSIIFKIIDFSTSEGEKIADKYEVSYSSLFVNKFDKNKEERNDLTEHSFKTAKERKEEFKEGLREKINSLLKR